MNPRTVSTISQQIGHQFPEVAGSSPNVRAQAGAKTPGTNATYLLTFKGRAQAHSGPSFPRTVRVVADDAGHILKVTTSR